MGGWVGMGWDVIAKGIQQVVFYLCFSFPFDSRFLLRAPHWLPYCYTPHILISLHPPLIGYLCKYESSRGVWCSVVWKWSKEKRQQGL